MKLFRDKVNEMSNERRDRIEKRMDELRDEINPKRQELWEILVPQANNDGEFIAIPEHNIWDSKVRKITGGLTIHRSAKGEWVSPEGELVVERMIPVRIACTEEQMHTIAQMTKEFYQQAKVMYYRVSDKVFIV